MSNDTITNATVTKCQHCGEYTNYADDPHHQARECIIQALGGLEEAERVVASLPKTKDGKVVVPGMKVYEPNEMTPSQPYKWKVYMMTSGGALDDCYADPANIPEQEAQS